MKYRVIRTYQVWDELSIEAPDKETAKEHAFNTPIPQPNYIDDSMVIDDEDIETYEDAHS